VVYEHDLHETLHHPAPRQPLEDLDTVPDVHALTHCETHRELAGRSYVHLGTPPSGRLTGDRAVTASGASFLLACTSPLW
jgi:hypothetical protein